MAAAVTISWGGKNMRPRSGIAIPTCFVTLIFAIASTAICGERAAVRKELSAQRMNAAAGYPGGGNDPRPLPGPRPYWGQALGATYYNWGFFGAHWQHPQYISHSGYYGQYYQFGATRGY